MAPVLPQLSSVTSEALQAKIRSLLPSQDGFGADLAASNVISLTLDLTDVAEGTSLPVDLARAASFGNITAWECSNTTTVIANTAGFYRIYGISNLRPVSGSTIDSVIQLSDGATTKNLWRHTGRNTTQTTIFDLFFDFEVFLNSGDSIQAVSDDTNAIMAGSVWQIANVNGVVTLPSGFSPQ